jgi:hypothetical protein
MCLENLKRRWSLGRTRHSREYDMEMDFKEIEWAGV